MKKTVFILMALCLLATGCSASPSAPEPEHAVQSSPVPADVDIEALFSAIKEGQWEYVACVPFDDRACGLAGAVLFTESGAHDSCGVAFLDYEGHYQRCGVGAAPADEPELRYLGNGAVTFRLNDKDGLPYDYTLTISIDGGDVHFVAEDSLNNQ